MVKFVAFEESFHDRCTRVPYFSYGIILGGSLKEEECLFLPIEAPIRSDYDGDHQKSVSPPKNVSEIDEKWVSKHCKNVLRMLPGGVRISGLFATVSNEELNQNIDKMIKILSSMSNADKISSKGLIANQSSEKIMLCADPRNKKLFCKAIDLDDNKDSLRNVEIRIKPVLCQFKALKTCISLSFSASLPTDRKKEKIFKKLEEASEPFLSNLVHQTDILICGHRRDDSDLLFESIPQSSCKEYKQTKSLIKLKKALIDTSDSSSDDYWSPLVFLFYGPDYHFHFRANSTSSSESGASSDTGFTGSSSSLHFSQRVGQRESNSRHRDFSGQRSASGTSPVKGSYSHQRNGFRSADEEFSDFYSTDELYNQPISIQGVIPGVAFLPIKTTTVADVKQAFREDLVRSTLSRLELLSEQLHISSGEFENPKMYLPQRVLVRLPACKPLPLSDYKFCSETQDEIVARLIWLSLPLGSHSTSESQSSLYAPITSGSSKRLSAGSIESDSQIELSPDSGNDSISEEPEIAIDASCVDFCLEATPNANQQQPKSERELLQEIDQSIKNVAKHSRSAMMVAVISVVILLMGIAVGYSLVSP